MDTHYLLHVLSSVVIFRAVVGVLANTLSVIFLTAYTDYGVEL